MPQELYPGFTKQCWKQYRALQRYALRTGRVYTVPFSEFKPIFIRMMVKRLLKERFGQ